MKYIKINTPIQSQYTYLNLSLLLHPKKSDLGSTLLMRGKRNKCWFTAANIHMHILLLYILPCIQSFI